MTTVTISKYNNRIRVSAIDHAYGSEAVCAGISVMMYALEAWLLNHHDYVRAHESRFKSGQAEIEFLPLDPKAYTILGFIADGLEQVEHSYGKQFLTVNVADELKELIR